jgi:hypothetical protein
LIPIVRGFLVFGHGLYVSKDFCCLAGSIIDSGPGKNPIGRCVGDIRRAPESKVGGRSTNPCDGVSVGRGGSAATVGARAFPRMGALKPPPPGLSTRYSQSWPFFLLPSTANRPCIHTAHLYSSPLNT